MLSDVQLNVSWEKPPSIILFNDHERLFQKEVPVHQKHRVR